MKFEIGAMSVGDILDRGLKILFARLGTFYAINLIVMAPLLLFELATPLMVEAMRQSGGSMAIAGPFMIGFFGVTVLTVVLAYVGEAACLHVVGQEFIGERVTVGQALGFAMRRFGTLLGVSLMVGLLIALGLMMCIVPAI